jgi:hypothetical protein
MFRSLIVLLICGSTLAPLCAHAQSDSVFAVSQSGTSLLRVNTDGNVGIGISNPSQRLTVNGGVQADSARVARVRFDDGSSVSSMLITPTPANYLSDWSDFGNGYTPVVSYKDPFGIVHLEGTAWYTGNSTSSSGALTLPVGQRPAGAMTVLAYGANGTMMVTILSSGGVNIRYYSGATLESSALISFTGITFLAAS